MAEALADSDVLLTPARPGGEAMLLALARQAGHSRFGGRGFAQQPGLPLARSRERV
ncbi:amidase [Bordetella pertussis]|nr:amidase [Bordetella pertussis]